MKTDHPKTTVSEREGTVLAEKFKVVDQVVTAFASRLTWKESLWKTHQCLSAVMPVDSMFLGLCQQENILLHLIFVVNENKKYPEIAIPLDTRIEKRVIDKNEAMLLNETDQTVNFVNDGGTKITRSLLAAPVTVRGQVIGVLSLQSYAKNAYTEEDKELVATISRVIGLALLNFMLMDARACEKEMIELTRMCGHELTQPLTGIAGYCNLIKEELTETDPFYDQILDIEKQAIRLEELIQKIQNIVTFDKQQSYLRNPFLNLLNSMNLTDDESS